jgi:hypothetical protein
LTKPWSAWSSMLRTFTTAASNTASSILPHPNLTAALSSPFSRNSLNTIRSALTRSTLEYSDAAADPKEKHAAVLIPLCNVNDKPGILLELRGKLRTHSGEVRCDNYHQDDWQKCLIRNTHVMLLCGVSSFPGGRVDPVSTPFCRSKQ